MAVKVIVCVVCSKDEGVKYKCPTCRSPYCSVACCQQHKQNCSPSLATGDGTEGSSNSSIPSETNGTLRPQYHYETEDTVPIERLELLRHSKELKELLGNPHLRRMMDAIDSSSDAAQLIGEAMREPIFTEMVDECMKIINGESNDSSDEL